MASSDMTSGDTTSANLFIEMRHREHGTKEISEPLLLANDNEQGYPLPISINDPGFDWSTLPEADVRKSRECVILAGVSQLTAQPPLEAGKQLAVNSTQFKPYLEVETYRQLRTPQQYRNDLWFRHRRHGVFFSYCDITQKNRQVSI